MRASGPYAGACSHWLLLALLYLLPASSARADEDLVLHWRAPDSCPSEAHVRATVLGWLAQSSEPRVVRGVEVEADVNRDARGHVLDLLLITPGGRAREQLVAAGCDTLAGVVAYKVGLATDSLPPPPAAVQWAVRATLGAGPGALPGFGTTLSAAGALRLGDFALELGVGYGFAQTLRYADHPMVGGELSMWSGSARLCVLPRLAGVELSVCTGPELGIMRGVGFGTATVFDARELYAAVALGPAARFRVAGGLFAYVGVDVQLALARPFFHVRNLPVLYRPELLAARLHLGAEWHFE